MKKIYTVKKMKIGFGVFDPNGILVQRYTGIGSKSKAEYRCKNINQEIKR